MLSIHVTSKLIVQEISHKNHRIHSKDLPKHDQYLESFNENFQLRGEKIDKAVLGFQAINKIVKEITDLEETLYSTRTSLEKSQVPFPIYSFNDRVAEIKKLLRWTF